MATLQELKDEILKGRRAKRRFWVNHWLSNSEETTVIAYDFFEDDWELEELPKVKKKVKLYAFYDRNNNNGFRLTAYPELTNISGDMTRLPNLDQEIEEDE